MNFKSLLRVRHQLVRLSYRSCKKSSIPELTQVRHNVKRGEFATLESKDIACFESIVGAKHVLQEDLDAYNIDFMRSVRGASKCVLKPGSVEEVSAIMQYCNERKLAVCPQSGNTGLVGGSVPVCDEIVLSLKRLDKIINIDELTGIMTCESGCILGNLVNAAKEVGLVVPLDLGAKASCLIGGNLSTNAGGLRVVRYGNLHGSVLGVEAVLANGRVLDVMSAFKKDNTGYHLKHLFIGSEGTLGIITKVCMFCPTISKSVHLAYLGVDSYENVLKIFVNAKRHLGEILSACEMMDAAALDASITHFKLTSPLECFPFYMVIETSGSNAEHDMEKMNNFFESGKKSGEIADGCITNEPQEIRDLWMLRLLPSVALVMDGHCFKYDVALPLRKAYSIVEIMRERVGHLATRVCGYGHLGDSNLHLNISCPKFTPEIYKLLEPFVYECTAGMKGSVSAEHGIGFLKKNYLNLSKSQNAICVMSEMKQLLDPNGILNSYKVLK